MANIAQHKYNIHNSCFFTLKFAQKRYIQYSLCRVQRSGAEDGAEDGAGRSRPFFNCMVPKAKFHSGSG